MATQPGPLYEFPWHSLGGYKYLVLAPLVARAIDANFHGGKDPDNFSLHLLIASALRLLVGMAWMTISRWPHLVPRYKIQRKGVNYKQMDREENWDDYIILNALLGFIFHEWVPLFQNFKPCTASGLLITLLMHVGPAEFLYYWLHRALHHHSLYSKYHSHHHASFLTEPVTATVHPFMEHLMYAAVFVVPFYATCLLGCASVGGVYAYMLAFDVLNFMGHCNFEFFPVSLFRALPFLKYLIYTPSFHSLHHTQVHTNFSLFMPIYDYLGGTWDPNSDALHEASRKPRKEQPDFVFLAHGMTIPSVLHMPFFLPYFASKPFAITAQQILLLPVSITLCLLYWAFAAAFPRSYTYLRGKRLESWGIPRLGFHYFLWFEQKQINRLIEGAILKADKQGVQVFTLGALNKNEALNGGGTAFIKKHPDLKLRLVHGNTLTAAVILQEISPDAKEVFLAGATSKLGRAIAIYLASKGTKVLMLTTSKERFDSIRSEAPADKQHLLVQVTDCKQASHCREWIVGKWLTAKQQSHAPKGTFFHQFVVPPLDEVRGDCVYGKLAAMRLPKDIDGLNTCELQLERGVVHACHAGGLVHMLEGWQHHEVGAIDVARIDITWQAAMRQGFSRV
ncbi:unnamed protein product [Closterium sp. Yama58-4]|nr:unnamed protein product [Closterium sp. Yama58-4]